MYKTKTSKTKKHQDKIVFKDHHMKMQVPFRVDAEFQRINQLQNDPNQFKVLFKRIPIALGYYLITPLENGSKYFSFFGQSSIK